MNLRDLKGVSHFTTSTEELEIARSREGILEFNKCLSIILYAEDIQIKKKLLHGFLHVFPLTHYISSLKHVMKNESVCKHSLSQHIKDMLSIYYYDIRLCRAILKISEKYLAPLIDFNTIKLQFIKSIYFRNELQKPKLSKNMFDIIGVTPPKYLQLFKFKELAEQLSITNEKYFRQIQISEFIDGNWLKEDKLEKSPNLCEIANFFNRLSNQIVAECLSEKRRDRVKSIIFFINLARELQKLNNYDLVMSVVGGLNNHLVQRLRKTWKSVDSSYMLIFNELNEITSVKSNYQNYRNLIVNLKANNQRFLPILSVTLRDLVFINQGSKNFINCQLNVEKLLLIGEIFDSLIFPFQNKLFKFLENQQIQNSILSMPAYDEDILINLSNCCEKTKLKAKSHPHGLSRSKTHSPRDSNSVISSSLSASISMESLPKL